VSSSRIRPTAVKNHLARLFLQQRGNRLRTGGQHSFRAGETKPFPQSFFLTASTETPAFLEKRDHLIDKGLKTLGINRLKPSAARSSTHFSIKSTICSGVPSNR
jgi:hypothetical protein